MADKGYTKMKLLYIKSFLEENSDEEHPVSVDEISDMLENKGIYCERKSIYSDVKTLKEYGVDIISVRQPKPGYCICSRDFELPELRLLIMLFRLQILLLRRKPRSL